MKQIVKIKSKNSKQELIEELWNISKNGSFRTYEEFRKKIH
ncbi:MAG: hypothetical protein ACMXYB_03020 [Candidatus Woesearchaeota archaeon]